MEILFIFIFLRVLIFENAIDQIEAGKINQEKSFDEIFGQRWDERTEENICRIGQIIHEQIADQNNGIVQNERQFDQNFNENMEVKDEESEEMSTNCDESDQLPINFGQISVNSDLFSNAIENKKREIVEKFHKIKEKIKQKEKKYSRKEWNKIERKIAKKLDVNQKKIYKWKREFGVMIKKRYSYEQKHEILNQFDQIYGKLKMQLNEKLDGKRQKCQKTIAKQLGIEISSIYRWKKELKIGKPIKNQKTDGQKRGIIKKYFKIKKEFMQMGKHSRKELNEFNAKIKQIFGVSDRAIEKWAKKIGINQNISKERKSYALFEKMEIMKQYYQMKKQNPKPTDRKIAEKLNIPLFSLNRYKSQINEKVDLL